VDSLIDVSGVRVLLDATAHARRDGRRLTFVNSPAILPRLLGLLRLEHALEMEAPLPPSPLPSSGGRAPKNGARLRLVPSPPPL